MTGIGIVAISTVVGIFIVYIWYMLKWPPFDIKPQWTDPMTGKKVYEDNDWEIPAQDNPWKEFTGDIPEERTISVEQGILKGTPRTTPVTAQQAQMQVLARSSTAARLRFDQAQTTKRRQEAILGTTPPPLPGSAEAAKEMMPGVY